MSFLRSLTTKLRNVKKPSLKTVFVVAIVIAVMIVMLAFMHSNKKSDIFDVKALSFQEDHIEISWSDDLGKSDKNVYCVYWSDKSNINIDNEETYTRKQTVIGTYAKLYTPYNYVYFVIADSENTITKEFEVQVLRSKELFDIRLVGERRKSLLINFFQPQTQQNLTQRIPKAVKIYYVISPETIFSEEFKVKNLSKLVLALKSFEDVMIFVEIIGETFRSKLKFVCHLENFF